MNSFLKANQSEITDWVEKCGKCANIFLCGVKFFGLNKDLFIYRKIIQCKVYENINKP